MDENELKEQLKKRQEGLDLFVDSLNKVFFSKHDAEKVIKNLEEINNRKGAVLNAMIQKAKDFDSVTNMIVQKDEEKLLKELVHLIKLEYRYLHSLRTKQLPISPYIYLGKNSYTDVKVSDGRIFPKSNSSWFLDKESVEKLYDSILEYISKRDNAFYKARVGVYEEKHIVEKWQGRSNAFSMLFRLITFRKHSVMTNFKQDLINLLDAMSTRYTVYEKDIQEIFDSLEKIKGQLHVLELKGLDTIRQEAVEEEKEAAKRAVESVREIKKSVENESDYQSSSRRSNSDSYHHVQIFKPSFSSSSSRSRSSFGGGGGRFGGGGASGRW